MLGKTLCEKLIENDDEKVPAIFHNLRGFDSYLIFDELKNFDVNIDVILNRLQKYIAFILNKT